MYPEDKVSMPACSPTQGADYFMKDNPETGGVLMGFLKPYTPKDIMPATGE